MADLIDRQAAVDAILHNQEVYSNNFGDDPIDKYTIAIIDNDAQTVAQLPSAQPERKTGRWITQTTYPYGTQCGNCGWAWSENIDAVKLDPIFSRIRTAYCPNCGADMRGDNNGNHSSTI